MALAQVTLPLQIGPINDYGQTLEAKEREELASLIEAFASRGLSLVYLASWRDPFSDPQRYAQEVFRSWRLGPQSLLLVLLRGEDRHWRVALAAGAEAAGRIPELTGLLSQAEVEANRIRPSYAAIRFLEKLLAEVDQPKVPPASQESGTFPWWWVVLGLGLFFLVLFLSFMVCPRCLRPLRRVRSFGGILWICPRCRYTRVSRRWGRRPGGRGGSYP